MPSKPSLRRIFVVGCPRSGTTVVQSMLASLPRVMTFGETNYFIRLLGQFDRWLREDPVAERKWRKRLRLAKRKTRRVMQQSLDEAFGEAMETPSLHWHVSGRGFIREFRQVLDRAAREHGCTCWVEKTPDHLAYVDVLAKELPDAHFLHVIRHGEDVLASAVDGQMRYSEHEVFGGSIPHWVTRWNRAASVHMRLAGDPRHTVLPYECLFNATDEVRALLRSLAGVDAGPVDGDGKRQSHIADLSDEPWKRGSTEGVLRPPERKFESLFGPDMQGWIRSQLKDYREVVAVIAAAQPELAWIGRAADGLPSAAA